MAILLVGTQTLGLGWMDMDYHITVTCQVQDRIQELWLQALSFQYSLGICFQSWTSFHEAETERLPPGPLCVFMYSSESFILMTIFCSSTSSCPAWIRSSIVCCQWNKQTAENEQLPTCPKHDQTAHDWYFALQIHEMRDFSWKNLTLGGMKGRRGSSFGLRINFGPIFSAPPFWFTHYNHTHSRLTYHVKFFGFSQQKEFIHLLFTAFRCLHTYLWECRDICALYNNTFKVTQQEWWVRMHCVHKLF